jgi:hypothetical protein
MSHDTLSWTPTGGGRPYLLVFESGTCSRVDLPASGALVIGRADADVLLNDQSSSRQHARLTLSDGLVEVADLESHSGTRVNGDRIAGSRPLSSGDVIAIGDASLLLYAAPVAGDGRPLLKPAALLRRLEEEVERAVSFERPLGVAVLSLAALPDRAPAATTLEGELRLIDVIGESEDGQLVVLMPELSRAATMECATRLAELPAAVGVAGLPGDGCQGETLLAAARAAAAAARPGAVIDVTDCGLRFDLAGHPVLVAEPAMLRLFEMVRRLAASDLPVVIWGESGSGKESVALALHHWSPRTSAPFVAIDCAAIVEDLPGLLESARGGTVFLDEVGDLPLAIQAKLQGALEARTLTRVGDVKPRPIDIRVVAATHRDLGAEVKAGRFREDLLLRLSGAKLLLPPLRERPRELARLAHLFLEEAAQGRELRLSAAALRALGAHSWPGNVQELKSVVRHMAAVTSDDRVEPWHLPESFGGAAPEPAPPPAAPRERHFRPIAEELRELETRRMQEALDACDGVQTRAAELISMPLRTFVMKLKQYGLRR